MKVKTDTLKVGIIGLGVGEAHIDGYAKHQGCEVVALCDIAEDKLTQARANYPKFSVTNNADEILQDPNIQVVSIASYDADHYEQIITAIEHDKHIFVEKPLCLHEKEALRIRELLNKKPHLKMSSNLILRMCPRFQSLKQRIQNNEMGELFHIEGDYDYGRLHKITEGWRGKLDFYSIAYGGGVHIADLLLWLTNQKITEVAGFANDISSRGTQFKFHDSMTCVVKFENGMTGKISVHFGSIRPHYHQLTVLGTKATFVNQEDVGLWYDSTDPEAPVHKMTGAYPGVHKGDLIYSFIDSIVGDTDCLVTKDDVFNTMSVCFAMEKSIAEGPTKVHYI